MIDQTFASFDRNRNLLVYHDLRTVYVILFLEIVVVYFGLTRDRTEITVKERASRSIKFRAALAETSANQFNDRLLFSRHRIQKLLSFELRGDVAFGLLEFITVIVQDLSVSLQSVSSTLIV